MSVLLILCLIMVSQWSICECGDKDGYGVPAQTYAGAQGRYYGGYEDPEGWTMAARNVDTGFKWITSDCKCRGWEMGSGRKTGTRDFRVLCIVYRPGRRGGRSNDTLCVEMVDPNELRRTDCDYTGNPHRCREYNSKQELFYTELRDVIGSAQCGKTTCPAEGAERYHTRRICSEIDFISKGLHESYYM